MELGGKPILNGLAVDFWEGHVHALVGPNGAGKSTLANTIMGLPGYTHHSGDILLDGEPLRGERKRVELASILAMEPRIVLMDEPDSGIDVEALQRIFDALVDFKAMGTTVIMITHRMAVLEHADHAFLLCNGRILDKGSVGKISGYFADNCIPCHHENMPAPEEEMMPA